MKNVMLITQSLKGGGAEKVISNLSLMLNGYCNIYIVSYRQDEDEFIHKGKRIDINIPGGDGPIVQRIVNGIRRIAIIRKLKKKLDIDFALSFVPQTDYANVLSKTFKCKNYIEISSNSLAAFNSFFIRIARRFILHRADKVITVSEGSRLQVLSSFRLHSDKVETIYNPIDLNGIQELASITNTVCLPDKFVIAIGSFRKPKGHWHLIKAFASIMDSISTYSLVILGDGEYRCKYEEIAEKLNIPKEKVIMPGYVDNPYYYLSKASLLVFSSIYEGFGNVILEAMCCGVPVVSTDCDFGPREIIAPHTDLGVKADGIEFSKYGCLVKPFDMGDIDTSGTISEDEKRLGLAIMNILNDEYSCNQYRLAGVKRCKEFSLEMMTKRWIALMELNK